jgi:archaellum component FlaC
MAFINFLKMYSKKEIGLTLLILFFYEKFSTLLNKTQNLLENQQKQIIEISYQVELIKNEYISVKRLYDEY